MFAGFYPTYITGNRYIRYSDNAEHESEAGIYIYDQIMILGVNINATN